MNRLINLFGGKKDDKEGAPKARKGRGYFMELDESTNTGETVAESNTPPLKVEATPQPATPAATQPAEPVVAAPASQPEVAKPAPVAKSEPKPAASASKPAATPAGMTFAPNFLITPSQPNSRRRPGPSMNSFLDLARQIKQSRPE